MALGPAEVAHGPFFIGTILNVCLYGIMITQTFLYFETFKNDRLAIKLFVFGLFLADTVNSVFDLVYLYDSLIIHFTDVAFLNNANWVFATDPAMTGIIATFVQLFFAWRVMALTKSKLAVGVILACATAGFFCSIGTSVAIGFVPHFTDFQKFKVVVIIWLVCTAICDVVITVALVWHLKAHRTGFSATDDIVNRIIRLTVQTGMITAIWAIVDLLVYLLDSTGLHLVFNVPLSKLYTNSLMSSLNSRGAWTNNRTASQPSRDVKSIPGEIQTTSNIRGNFHKSPGLRPQVFINVESHEMIDVEDGGKTMDSIFTQPVPDLSRDRSARSDSKWTGHSQSDGSEV